VNGLRELTPDDGFPPLPKVDLLLYQAAGVTSPAVDALHNYLARYVGMASADHIELRKPIAARAGAAA
jgi:hypothetical protein